MKLRKLSLYLLLITAVVTGACQLDVPIKEMINAKKQINRAIEVKAEKYDIENLKKAKASLYKTHIFLKEEKADDAKKSAIESAKFSQAAIDKSLPLLSKDTLSEAKKLYSEAGKLYSEKFASEDYKQAGESIQKAEDFEKEKKYWDAYLQSKTAIVSANNAKDKSIANKSSLKGEIDLVKSEMDELNQNKYSKETKEELALVKTAVADAKKDLEDDELKKASANLIAAQSKIKEAKKIIQKLELSEKIENIKVKISDLKAKSGSEVAKDDIDSASGILKEAETTLSEENFGETSAKISEAEITLEAANEKISKSVSKSKIKKMREEILAIKNSDTNEISAEELKSAELSLNDAKTNLSSGMNKEAINQIQEAEKSIAEAKKKINKETAEKKYYAVEKFFSEIQSSDKENKFTEELKNPAELLVASKKSLDENFFDDSILKSDEANAILSGLHQTVEKEYGTISSSNQSSDKYEDSSKGRTYTVKWRKKNTDCLWKISLRVYKKAGLWPLIYKANKNQIKNPDLIFPGQKFKIPPKPVYKKAK